VGIRERLRCIAATPIVSEGKFGWFRADQKKLLYNDRSATLTALSGSAASRARPLTRNLME
jgi:hypothetical protein